MDVRVDGNHELRRSDAPEAEVDAVGGANHPARVEKEALAGASRTGVAHEVTQASTARVAAKRIGETGEAFPKVSVACPMKAGECLSERFALPQ